MIYSDFPDLFPKRVDFKGSLKKKFLTNTGAVFLFMHESKSCQLFFSHFSATGNAKNLKS